MGAAAIVRGKKDAVREEDMKDDKSLAYIPLNKITDNIKVYQHCDNGQVMVLLYQTLEDVLQNGDIENWAECQGKKINFINYTYLLYNFNIYYTQIIVSPMQKSYASNIKAYVQVDKVPDKGLTDYQRISENARLSINSVLSDGNRDSFISHKSRDSFFSQRESILSVSSSVGDLGLGITTY